MSATTSFLSLPPELRNRIYELALPVGESYRIYNGNTIEDIRGQRQYITNPLPPITCVSHQTREKSLPIWRSTNIFKVAPHGVNGTGDPWGGLLMLGKTGLEHIRVLEAEESFYGIEYPVYITAKLRMEEDVYHALVEWRLVPGFEVDATYTRLAHGKVRAWAAMIGTLSGSVLKEAEDSPMVTVVRVTEWEATNSGDVSQYD